MSEYQRVQEFNRAADQPCPNTPRPMTKEETHFITKMMLDEIMELMVTVEPEYKVAMIKMIGASRDLKYDPELKGDELAADQGDALVDSNYYALNAAVKCGIQLDKIFDTVHSANMAKCDPVSGKFNRREDGKILKPKGWKSPDIVEVVKVMYPDPKQTKITDHFKKVI